MSTELSKIAEKAKADSIQSMARRTLKSMREDVAAA
jgi:hypothetical protein